MKTKIKNYLMELYARTILKNDEELAYALGIDEFMDLSQVNKKKRFLIEKKVE